MSSKETLELMEGTAATGGKNLPEYPTKDRSSPRRYQNTERATICGLNCFRESLAARCQFGST